MVAAVPLTEIVTSPRLVPTHIVPFASPARNELRVTIVLMTKARPSWP